MDCKPDSETVVMEGQLGLRQNLGRDTPRRPDSGPNTRFTELLVHDCPTDMEFRLTSGSDTPPGALLEHQTPDIIRTACLERERVNRYRMIVYWDGHDTLNLLLRCATEIVPEQGLAPQNPQHPSVKRDGIFLPW